MEGKIINLLHLARKSGKLQFGFDACEKSCFKGKSRLGTKKLFGESFKTRDVGIISIEDHNFAKGIIRLIV
jgi:hypothetical protein